MKNIVVFGATGMTGLCAVEEALKKGYNVKAFVRDPAKLPENLKSKVEVFKGDVLNYTDVINAIKGVDGVVVILGTRNDLKPTTVLSDGMKMIIKAMKEAKVEVVSVCLSAYLYDDVESPRIPKMFYHLNLDHKRMYDAIKDTDLKYIAVFPPLITKDPPSGYVVKNENLIGRRISKYDLGEFLIDSLNKPEFYGNVVGVVSTVEIHPKN